MPSLKTQEDAVALLKSATSDEDWNDKVDQIQAANGGYPSWWYIAVIAPGLPQQVSSTWGGDGYIHIS